MRGKDNAMNKKTSEGQISFYLNSRGSFNERVLRIAAD